MEMHNEKNQGFDNILGAVNEHLYGIGLIDTVDTYLNSDDAQNTVKSAYDNWMADLKEFVGNMPEVAREAAMKVVEYADSTKGEFKTAIFLAFKQNLSGALQVLENYLTVESLVEEMLANPNRQQMWNIKLNELCTSLLAVANEKVLVDMIINAIDEVESTEDQMALTEAIMKLPNGNEVMNEVDRQLCAHEAASILAGGLMEAIFGGDIMDEDDEE